MKLKVKRTKALNQSDVKPLPAKVAKEIHPTYHSNYALKFWFPNCNDMIKPSADNCLGIFLCFLNL